MKHLSYWNQKSIWWSCMEDRNKISVQLFTLTSLKKNLHFYFVQILLL